MSEREKERERKGVLSEREEWGHPKRETGLQFAY